MIRPEGLLRGSFLVLDIEPRLDLSFFRDGRCRWQAQRDMIRDNMEKEITILGSEMSEPKLTPIHVGGIADMILGIAASIAGLVFVVIMSIKAQIYIPGFLPIAFIFGGASLAGTGYTMYRRAGHRKKTKKVRLESETAKMFQEADSRSPLVATLRKGDELIVGAVKRIDEITWIQISLPEGKTGYIASDTLIVHSLCAETLAAETPVYRIPDLALDPLCRLFKGSKLEVCEEAYDEGIHWIPVWLPDGKKGYIRHRAKVNWI